MLIYGVSGIFAHKKTIRQFLQPIIEQVWGGDVPEGCAAFFASVFQSYCIFVSVFSIHRWSILPIFAYSFAVYYVHFIKKSNSVLGTKFHDVQLIPNFLRYPAWLWYCSFWTAMLATNCLIDGFSYSNNILTKLLWGKTAEWSEIKIRFKIYMVLNSL